MKISPLPLLLVLSLAPHAQDALPVAGPHHRVITAVRQIERSDGSVGVTTNSWVHLEAGLNRLSNNQWVVAEERLEIIGDTVVAGRTAQQVIWAANANTAGAVDLSLPDGQRLRGHCLGLGYYDAATGQSVLIAELKDCVAEVNQPNIVIYRDAFDDLDADLVYLNRRASFQQWVVLHAPIPATPEDFGLDPATTRLELISEFLDPPLARKTTRVLRQEPDQRLRADMVEPDLVDDELDFGSMRMPEGQAFLPAGELWRMEAAAGIPVAKRWQIIEGRTILFEAVEYARLEPLLAALAVKPDGPRVAERRQPSNTRILPARRLASRPSGSIQMATALCARPGVVLDYTLLASGQANFTFQGGVTYYLASALAFTGTNTTFEGGAVIKFAPTNSPRLDLACSNVTWLASPYRPVAITGRDDSSIGESITNSPLSGYYATTALNVLAPLTNVTFGHLRVAHAQTALAFSQGSGHTVSHAQMVNCGFGLKLSSAEACLRNALMVNLGTNFLFTSATGRVEHLTVNGAARLNSAGVLYLTNSLIVAVTATNGWSGLSNQFVSSASGVFAAAAAGSHYLAAGSPYRNAGTNAINPTLQTELKAMTTVAPSALTDVIATPTTLGPQVLRDTDTPDLGYHYWPIDFYATTLTISNTTLTLTNGVALGFYGATWIWPREGSTFISEGTPGRMNCLVPLVYVQEQPLASYASGQPNAINPYVNVANPPNARLWFTRLEPAGGYSVYQGPASGSNAWRLATLEFRHSQVGPGLLRVEPGVTNATVMLVNNLLERHSLTFEGTLGLQAYHNLLRLSEGTFFNYGGNTWTVKDTVFDNAGAASYGLVDNGWNAYINAGSQMSGGTNDVVLASFAYTNGTLGRYYHLSTNLLNRGSRSPEAAGLYHFTVLASQAKDTNAPVDIGFHYVATDANGSPLDSDCDGLPDGLEDHDGDNALDAGETSWTTSNSGISGAAGLQVFTPLK